MGLQKRPDRGGSVEHSPARPKSIFVPNGASNVKRVIRGDSAINAENMLEVGNFQEPQCFIVPRSIVGHVGLRINVQESLPVFVDEVRRDLVVGESTTSSGVHRLDRGLRKIAVALQCGGLIVTGNAGRAYAQSAAGIRDSAFGVVR